MQPEKITSVAAWKGRDEQDVTCPSGAIVRLCLPDLAVHFQAGDTPDHFRKLVVATAGYEGRSLAELSDEEAEARRVAVWAYNCALLVECVVRPKLKEGDVQSLPERDVEFLLQIVKGMRDIDAAGEAIGVEALAALDRFRAERGGLDGGEEDERVVLAVSPGGED